MVGKSIIFDGIKGVVTSECDTILVVQLVNGQVIKCFNSEVTLVQEEEPKDVITISRKEFMDAVKKATNPSNYDKNTTDPTSAIMISLSGIVVCGRLEKELFGEKADND